MGSIDPMNRFCSASCKLSWGPSKKDLEEEQKKRKALSKPNSLKQENSERRSLIKKIRHQKKKLKLIEKKISIPPHPFFDSKEWLELRYRVLKANGRTCMSCGRSDIEVHVDHIKPMSKFPALALDFGNLQVLCRPCKLGKSNGDETDWRPHVRRGKLLWRKTFDERPSC